MSVQPVAVPLWVLVDEVRHAEDGLPTSTAIFKDPAGHGDFIPLFTSQSLADEFVKASTLAGHAPLRLATRREVESLVEDVAKLPGVIIFIAFDPIFSPHRLGGRAVSANVAMNSIVDANVN